MKKLLLSIVAAITLATTVFTPAASAWGGNNNDISRADFSVMLVKNLPEIDFDLLNNAEGCFDDVVGHYAESFICYLEEEGIFDGFADGNFRPQSSLTRAEASVLLTRTYNLDTVHELRPLYSDMQADAWYTHAINTMAVYGIPEPEVQVGDAIHPNNNLSYTVAKNWVMRASNDPIAQNFFPTLSFLKGGEGNLNVVNGERDIKIFDLKLVAENSDILVTSLEFRVDGLNNRPVVSSAVLYQGNQQLSQVEAPNADGEIYFDNLNLAIEEGDAAKITLYVDLANAPENVGEMMSIVLNGYEVEDADGNVALVDTHNFPLRSQFIEILGTGVAQVYFSDLQPEGRVVMVGEEDVDLLTLEVSAHNEDMEFESMRVNISGLFDFLDIDQVELVDENGDVISVQPLFDEDGDVEFRNIDLVVEDGETRQFTVRVDVSEFAQVGSTFRVSIDGNEEFEFTGMTSGVRMNADPGADFPIFGEMMTIGEAFERGFADIRNSAQSWRADAWPGEEVTILTMDISADDAEDLSLSEIAFNLGRLQVEELRLVDASRGWNILARGTADANGLVTLELNEDELVIAAGERITLEVEVNVSPQMATGWYYVALNPHLTEFIGLASGEVIEAANDVRVGRWVRVW